MRAGPRFFYSAAPNLNGVLLFFFFLGKGGDMIFFFLLQHRLLSVAQLCEKYQSEKGAEAAKAFNTQQTVI